tara:strand:- start:87 stop:545 length:459 start_codon:yes stop_codon:yes gene_type:complete
MKLVYTNTFGEVISISFMPAANAPEEGFDSETNTHLFYVDEEPLGDLLIWMRTHYRDFTNNTWATRSEAPNDIASWNGSAWVTDLDKFKDLIREDRNGRLIGSDWTQFVDVPLTTEQKEAWATYRQALRDIPATITSSMTSSNDINWPTEPS